MRLDGYLSSHVVEPFIRSGIFLPQPGIPILMYHSVSDDNESQRGDYYRLCTPPALFREHMAVLKAEDFSVVDISTAVAVLEGSNAGDPPPGRLVVLTFDDGFHNFLTNAWPILSDFAFASTVFLPTRFIGAQRVAFQGRDCLTWDEVRALRADGVTIGSHTVSHPKLVEMDEAGLRQELSESRRVIENELAEEVSFFSHPYAFPQADAGYISRYRRAMTQAGYRAGVTTRLGRARYGDDPLMLKRLPVNGTDQAALLRAKLLGAYDWLHGPQLAMQWIKRSGNHLAATR